MDHADHVALIRDAIGSGETWLELGSGEGAFTLALAELLRDGTIVSVDQDHGALATQARAVATRFPEVQLSQRAADFTRPLELGPVDGVLMANALHFVRAPRPVLALVHTYLRPGGKLLVVEYDADQGNRWVPHPVSWTTWERLAPENGFSAPRLLGRVPSRFLDAIYASVATAV